MIIDHKYCALEHTHAHTHAHIKQPVAQHRLHMRATIIIISIQLTAVVMALLLCVRSPLPVPIKYVETA